MKDGQMRSRPLLQWQKHIHHFFFFGTPAGAGGCDSSDNDSDTAASYSDSDTDTPTLVNEVVDSALVPPGYGNMNNTVTATSSHSDLCSDHGTGTPTPVKKSCSRTCTSNCV